MNKLLEIEKLKTLDTSDVSHDVGAAIEEVKRLRGMISKYAINIYMNTR